MQCALCLRARACLTRPASQEAERPKVGDAARRTRAAGQWGQLAPGPLLRPCGVLVPSAGLSLTRCACPVSGGPGGRPEVQPPPRPLSSAELPPPRPCRPPTRWPAVRGAEHRLTLSPCEPRYVMAWLGRWGENWPPPGLTCDCARGLAGWTLLVLAQPETVLARRRVPSMPWRGTTRWRNGTPVGA